MKHLTILLFGVFLFVFFAACEKEPTDNTPQSPYSYVTSWSSLGTSNEFLNNPKKIIATDSFVFVNDHGNGKIKKFDHNGLYLGALNFNNPFYIHDTLLYVISNTNSNDLLVYNFNLSLINSYTFPTALPTNGDIGGKDRKALITMSTTSQPFLMSLDFDNLTTNSFGTLGTAALNFQWNGAFAIDYDNGNYFVTDGGNYRVQQLDESYSYLSEFKTTEHSVLNSPNVIDVNSEYIIISNHNNGGDEIDFYDRNTNSFLFELEVESYFKQSISANQNKFFVLVDHPVTEVRVYSK
jgi:hypothetical protein